MKPPTELDATDRRILRLLQDDASRTNLTLAQAAHVSPPTCLRRVRRLRESGVIEREVAILDPQAVGAGGGLTAIVELTLEQPSNAHCDAFEALAQRIDAVQQCYRVSPGPDFVLVVFAPSMDAYHLLVRQLLEGPPSARYVKTYFSQHRAKFDPRVPVS